MESDIQHTYQDDEYKILLRNKIVQRKLFLMVVPIDYKSKIGQPQIRGSSKANQGKQNGDKVSLGYGMWPR